MVSITVVAVGSVDSKGVTAFDGTCDTAVEGAPLRRRVAPGNDCTGMTTGMSGTGAGTGGEAVDGAFKMKLLVTATVPCW